jgi:hypothetical protein
MFRHVVVFTWLPEATAEQIGHAAAEIATLPQLMEGLVGYAFGADLNLSEGNADFAIVADFTDTDAYIAYRDHPAHVHVVTHAVRPITGQRLAVQFEI